MERSRLKAMPGNKDHGSSRCTWLMIIFIAYLYHEFNHPADFEAAVKHAQDLDVLLWSNPKKRSMVITQSYVKREYINEHACSNEPISVLGVTIRSRALSSADCKANHNKIWSSHDNTTRSTIVDIPSYILYTCKYMPVLLHAI